MREDRSDSLPCPRIVAGQKMLTSEQGAFARGFAQELIETMLSCTPIDEVEAEEQVRQAYQVAGFGLPSIRWFDSPVAFVLASQMRAWEVETEGVEKQLRQRIAESVLSRVEPSLWLSVGQSIITGIWEGLGCYAFEDVDPSVWERLGGEGIRAGVWETCKSSLDERLVARVEDSDILDRDTVQEQLGLIIQSSLRAYDDDGWLPLERFFHEAFETNQGSHFYRFSEMVSGYWLGAEEVWLVRKAIRLERDEQGRLHNVEGSCLEYRDGWSVSAWHGEQAPG